MILQAQNYSVEATSTGTQAWESFQAAALAGTGFDIVIADYKMGDDMDGLELIRRIRDFDNAAPIPTRIILLTAHADYLGIPDSETGANAVIPKTNTEVPELIRTVKKLAVHPHRRRPPTSVPRPPKAVRKSESA